METKDVIDKIVQKLFFEVEEIPQENLVSFTSKSQIKPVNVKVRLRKKSDHEKSYNGFISIPKLGQSTSKPEIIRLAKSDQTIISFNLLMEENNQTQNEKKPPKKMFNLFKAGGCLTRNDDDDEYAYLPRSSINNVQELIVKTSSKYTNHKKFKTPKKIFGQCKPGGCLDPPFDEEKYSYFPAMNKRTVSLNNRLKLNLNKQKINKLQLNSDGDESLASTGKDEITALNKEVLRSSVTKEKVDSKYVVSIYEKASMETSLDNSYSNSIITYPSLPSSSNVRSNNETMSFNETNDTKSIISRTYKLSNEMQEIYFVPPKKNIQTKRRNDKLGNQKYSKNIYDPKVEKIKDEGNTLTTDTSSIKKSTSSALDVHILSTNSLFIENAGLKPPKYSYNDINNCEINKKLQPWLGNISSSGNTDKERNASSNEIPKLKYADLSFLIDEPLLAALESQKNLMTSTQHEYFNEKNLNELTITGVKNKEDISNSKINNLTEKNINVTKNCDNKSSFPEIIEIMKKTSFKSDEYIPNDEKVLRCGKNQMEFIKLSVNTPGNSNQSDKKINEKKSTSLLNNNNKITLNKMVTSSNQEFISLSNTGEQKTSVANSTLKIINNNNSNTNPENTFENSSITESIISSHKKQEKIDCKESRNFLVKSSVTQQESLSSNQRFSKKSYDEIPKAVEVKHKLTNKISNEYCDKAIVKDSCSVECQLQDKFIKHASAYEQNYKQNNFTPVMKKSSYQKPYNIKSKDFMEINNKENKAKLSITSTNQYYESISFKESFLDPDARKVLKRENEENIYLNSSQRHEYQSVKDENIIDTTKSIYLKEEYEPFDPKEYPINHKHISAFSLQNKIEEMAHKSNSIIFQQKESIDLKSDTIKTIDCHTTHSYFLKNKAVAITPLSNDNQSHTNKSTLESIYDINKIVHKKLEETEEKKGQFEKEYMQRTVFNLKNVNSLSIPKFLNQNGLDLNSVTLQQKQEVDLTLKVVKSISIHSKRGILKDDNDVNNIDNKKHSSQQESNKPIKILAPTSDKLKSKSILLTGNIYENIDALKDDNDVNNIDDKEPSSQQESNKPVKTRAPTSDKLKSESILLTGNIYENIDKGDNDVNNIDDKEPSSQQQSNKPIKTLAPTSDKLKSESILLTGNIYENIDAFKDDNDVNNIDDKEPFSQQESNKPVKTLAPMSDKLKSESILLTSNIYENIDALKDDIDVNNIDDKEPFSQQESNKPIKTLAPTSDKLKSESLLLTGNIYENIDADAASSDIKSKSNSLATTECVVDSVSSKLNPAEVISSIDNLKKNAKEESLVVKHYSPDVSSRLKNQLIAQNNNNVNNESSIVNDNIKIILGIPFKESRNNSLSKENKSTRSLEILSDIQTHKEFNGSRIESQITLLEDDQTTNSFSFTNKINLSTKNEDLQEPTAGNFHILEDENIKNKEKSVKYKTHQKGSVNVKNTAEITNTPVPSIKQNYSNETALHDERDFLTSFTNLMSQNQLEKNFQLELGFQSYYHTNQMLVIKTFDTSKEPNRYPTDTVSTLKTTAFTRLNNNFVVSLDEQYDMFINIVQKFKPPNLDNRGRPETNNIGLEGNQIKRTNIKEENSRLVNSLNMIYELQLLPLQDIIKSLKIEIDHITEKQDIVRSKLRNVNKAKSIRIISANNRCGCLRK